MPDDYYFFFTLSCCFSSYTCLSTYTVNNISVFVINFFLLSHFFRNLFNAVFYYLFFFFFFFSLRDRFVFRNIYIQCTAALCAPTTFRASDKKARPGATYFLFNFPSYPRWCVSTAAITLHNNLSLGNHLSRFGFFHLRSDSAFNRFRKLVQVGGTHHPFNTFYARSHLAGFFATRVYT